MLYEDRNLAPYRGNEPYVFLSYSHRDADAAAEMIDSLKKAGFRLWYDEGIIPGTEWDENIANKIAGCGYFIALISKAYLASSNCRDELNYARDREKPRLLIYLEEVTLPAGMEMRLNRLLAIHQYKYRKEDRGLFWEKVFQAEGIEVCRQTPAESGEAEPEKAPEAPEIPAHKTVTKSVPAGKKRSGKGKLVGFLLLAAAAIILAALFLKPKAAGPAEVQTTEATLAPMPEEIPASTAQTDAAPASVPTGSALADGYLFCLDDGMPKYWLDFTRSTADSPTLHCYFRSSDPTFYESTFVLDMSTADIDGYTYRFHNISDQHGFDCSGWFQSLVVTQYSDGAIMTVERDERTLAGGSEDNIFTGTYPMYPVGVGLDAEGGGTFLRPVGDGPYTVEELARWAQIYYFRNNGYFPPKARVTVDPEGTYTIQLYEVNDMGGVTHTATSAWYTVDACGHGENVHTQEPVDLTGK